MNVEETPWPRGNVWRLAVAQALAGANSVVTYATGAIVGHSLAPASGLATVPVSVFVLGMAASILPFGALARRSGRRVTFLVGTLAGALAGVLTAMAVWLSSFVLLCLGMLLGGAYAAVVLSFRFAAADGLPAAQRARAMSWVMGGGVAAGIVGPQLVNWTMDLIPLITYLATYLVQAAVALVSMFVLWGVQLPQPVASPHSGGRPVSLILRQPAFVLAAMVGAVSYLLMNFLMTAAPLAMHLCGLPRASASTGLQWHVIAMYAPSFFTGHLIARYSAPRVALVGLLLIGLSVSVGLWGQSVNHFWGLLVLLGVGWNFGFLGASAMVLDCHTPQEATRVQALNDFLVFGVMALGSMASGGVLALRGWSGVLWVALVPLGAALMLVGARARTKARAPAGA